MKWFKFATLTALFVVGLCLNFDNPILKRREIKQTSQVSYSKKAIPKRAPAQAEQKYGVLEIEFVDVYEAVLANPPEGRNWEHLPQDEFIEAVEDWVDEILLAANLSISNPRAKIVGERLFGFRSPYLQYIGFTLVYRSGLYETAEIEKHFLKLSSHSLMHDLYVEDLDTAPHEHQVRHKLVVGMIEVYGRRLLSNIHQNVSEEEWDKSRYRILAEIEKMPDEYTRVKLSTVLHDIY